MEKAFDDAIEYLKILWLFCRVVGLVLLSPIWILPYLVYKKRGLTIAKPRRLEQRDREGP